MAPSPPAAYADFLRYDAGWQKFRDVQYRRWGHQDLSPGALQGIFEEVARPDAMGFTRVRSGWYGRPVDAGDDMFHVLRCSMTKGGTGAVTWGVSLTFVPHGWLRSGTPRWHRTLRSIRMDHGEDPTHHVLLGGQPPAPIYRLYPETFYGDEAYRIQVKDAWEMLRPMAQEWFASIRNVSSVLHRMDRIRSALGDEGNSSADEVRPFLLARLGRMEEARKGVEAAMKEWELDKAIAGPRLRAALEKAAGLAI